MSYSEEELELLHKVLYEILGEIIRVCDMLHIPYFIQGGTAIGAFFENGILPWDDDIDVGMTRENYERFLKEAPAVLKKDYFLQWIGSDPHTPFYFAKLRKNGTKFVEDVSEGLDMHHGIFVDIFPYDKVPDNQTLQKIQRSVAMNLNLCIVGKEKWLWPHFGKPATSNVYQWNWFYCLILRIFFTLFSKRTIYNMFCFVEKLFNKKNCQFYNILIMKKDHIAVSAIENLEKRPFGPFTVTAPSDLETYLRRHYRNLRRYIPKEEQVNHKPIVLDFGA